VVTGDWTTKAVRKRRLLPIKPRKVHKDSREKRNIVEIQKGFDDRKILKQGTLSGTEPAHARSEKIPEWPACSRRTTKIW